jgi:hypothetical protein
MNIQILINHWLNKKEKTFSYRSYPLPGTDYKILFSKYIVSSEDCSHPLVFALVDPGFLRPYKRRYFWKSTSEGLWRAGLGFRKVKFSKRLDQHIKCAEGVKPGGYVHVSQVHPELNAILDNLLSERSQGRIGNILIQSYDELINNQPDHAWRLFTKDIVNRWYAESRWLRLVDDQDYLKALTKHQYPTTTCSMKDLFIQPTIKQYERYLLEDEFDLRSIMHGMYSDSIVRGYHCHSVMQQLWDFKSLWYDTIQSATAWSKTKLGNSYYHKALQASVDIWKIKIEIDSLHFAKKLQMKNTPACIVFEISICNRIKMRTSSNTLNIDPHYDGNTLWITNVYGEPPTGSICTSYGTHMFQIDDLSWCAQKAVDHISQRGSHHVKNLDVAKRYKNAYTDMLQHNDSNSLTQLLKVVMGLPSTVAQDKLHHEEDFLFAIKNSCPSGVKEQMLQYDFTCKREGYLVSKRSFDYENSIAAHATNGLPDPIVSPVCKICNEVGFFVDNDGVHVCSCKKCRHVSF